MAEFANPVIDIHLHWCAFGCRYEGVVEELAVLAGAGYEAVVFYPLPGLGASPEKVRDLIPGPYLDLTGIDSRRTALDDLGTWREFYRHLGRGTAVCPYRPSTPSWISAPGTAGRTWSPPWIWILTPDTPGLRTFCPWKRIWSAIVCPLVWRRSWTGLSSTMRTSPCRRILWLTAWSVTPMSGWTYPTSGSAASVLRNLWIVSPACTRMCPAWLPLLERIRKDIGSSLWIIRSGCCLGATPSPVTICGGRWTIWRRFGS